MARAFRVKCLGTIRARIFMSLESKRRRSLSTSSHADGLLQGCGMHRNTRAEDMSAPDQQNLRNVKVDPARPKTIWGCVNQTLEQAGTSRAWPRC